MGILQASRMRRIFLILPLLLLPQFVFAGSQTFTSSGTFTVPSYGSLTVDVWGAGASGGSIISSGNAGNASYFDVITAGGGRGGTPSRSGASGGVGGTATGGDVNLDGNSGQSGSVPGRGGVGGAAPGGGGGGSAGVPNACTGGSGAIPGGGGGGSCDILKGGRGAGGGGSGAYAQKTYENDSLAARSNITVEIGAGGGSA